MRDEDSKITRKLNRRAALGVIGSAVGTILIAGCGGGSSSTTASGTSGGTSGCTVIPDETAGPYPADGSNTSSGTTVDVLTDSRILRSNITSDMDGSNTQTGIPLTLTVTLENTNSSCAALKSVYVYIWHCSKDGSYSAYSATANGGNFEGHSFLRGVQQSDSNGKVTFVTIYPGRYDPRATHIHVEVYPNSNFDRSQLLATTQFAFPDDINTTVYNSSGYTGNQARGTTNANDQVFGTNAGGDTYQLLTVTGNTTNGYTATITVGVAA